MGFDQGFVLTKFFCSEVRKDTALLAEMNVVLVL